MKYETLAPESMYIRYIKNQENSVSEYFQISTECGKI